MNPNFSKLARRFDKYFRQAPIEELEVLYFMLEVELKERDLIEKELKDDQTR